MQVTVDVPEGSAGFKCDEQLVINRVDAGGRAEAAGVQRGWRVVAFQGEQLGAGFTWTELKGLAKTTPKPWQFAFGPVGEAQAEGVGQPTAAAAGPTAGSAAPNAEVDDRPVVSAEDRAHVRELFRAAKSGQVDALERAISSGIDVNVTTRDGWSALLMASWAGHADCVLALRKAGANVDSAARETTGHAPYLEARRMVYEERMASNEQHEAGVARLVEIPMRARTVEDFDTTFRDSFAVKQ